MSASESLRSLLLQIGNGVELPLSFAAALIMVVYFAQHWHDVMLRRITIALACLFFSNAMTRVIIVLGLNQVNFGMRIDTTVYYLCLPPLRFAMAGSIWWVGYELASPLGWGRHWAAFGLLSLVLSAGLVAFR